MCTPEMKLECKESFFTESLNNYNTYKVGLKDKL